MEVIKVSIDVLESETRRLQYNIETIRRSLNEIKEINDIFKQGWSGERNNIFHEKLDNCDNMSINELMELCEQFSECIKDVSNAYRATEDQMQSVICGIQ